MGEEIKEVLDKLRNDDYYEKEYQKSVYYERDLKKLEDYITNLQEEIERLQERIEDLNAINKEHRMLNGMIRKELQQKENIIKEVREYIKNLTNFHIGYGLNENDIKRTMYASEKNFVKDILEILDKGEIKSNQ